MRLLVIGMRRCQIDWLEHSRINISMVDGDAVVFVVDVFFRFRNFDAFLVLSSKPQD